jgi:hypothetical protein
VRNSAELRNLLPRYLLGDLTPEQTAEIDEQYLSDESFADLLEEVRRDLLDGLVAGELTAEERERVEKAFVLAEEQPGVLKVARALRAEQEATVPSPRSRATGLFREHRSIWAVAAVIVCSVTLAIFVQRRFTTAIPSPSQVAQTRSTPSAPSAIVPHPPQETTFVVLLSPEVSRDANAPKSFKIPQDSRFVEFQIVLAENSAESRYKVDVCAEQSAKPLVFSDLQPKVLGSKRYLDLQIPAHSTPPGKYFVRIYSGTAPHTLLAAYEISVS